MASSEDLRSFVKRLLTIAAEDILVAFQQKITEYEEKIDSQHRLLDILRPGTTLRCTDFPHQHVCKDKWVLTDHEWNPGLASDPPQIKEHLSSTRKEAQPVIYNDEMLRSFHQERNRSDYHSLDLNLDDSLQRSLGNMSAMNSEEPEPNLKLFSNSTHVVKYQKGDRQGDSGSTIPEELKPLHKDFQGQHIHIYKEEDEEVLVDQEQWNTEKASGLYQEDIKPHYMKDEHLRIAEEEEQIVLKQESDASPFPFIFQTHSQVQTPNPDENSKESVAKLSLLNSVMSESNSDPLPLSASSCEGKVRGQRKTRRDGSRPTRQDKKKTQKRQYKGKRHAKKVQVPSKVKTDRNSDKGEKPFKCDTCGKLFKVRSNLHIHIRIHTGERPYVCKTCGKSFTQQGHLGSHVLIHTGERPHVCVTCKKGFLRKKSLNDHMLTHTGQHPYVCATCGTDFSLKKDLTAHVKTHKLEKPHACRTCGKAFTLKSTLKSHMRLHKST